MSKIDASKCKFYTDREYISNDNGYTEYPDYCSCYTDGHCLEHSNCYYRQLQQLKAENNKYKQCLDDIEEYCKEEGWQNYSKHFVETSYILQKIKEVKNNEQEKR